MVNDPHYRAVREYYGDRCARRSGVRYMNHIDEGLFLLGRIGASRLAMRAFCLHPMVQLDDDLAVSLAPGSVFRNSPLDPAAVALAMAYREAANRYLSLDCETGEEPITLSPIDDVNDMLIADKIQNRKDFELYHLGSHPRSDYLVLYFANWLRALGVSEADYKSHVAALKGAAGDGD